MPKLLLWLVTALVLSVAPALPQSDNEIDTRIDTVLGDHTLYRAAFDGLQAAIDAEDAAAFASWVSYPIKVVADGEEMVIGGEEQFVEHFDTIVTEEISTAISGQAWQDVFVNDQGVMLGDGQVWLNGICADDACAEFDVKVSAIQSTSN